MKCLLDILNAEKKCCDEIDATERLISRLIRDKKKVESYPYECSCKTRDLAEFEAQIEICEIAKKASETRLSEVQAEIRNYFSALFAETV